MIFQKNYRMFLPLTILWLSCHTSPKQPAEGLENFEHIYSISYSEEKSTVSCGVSFLKDDKRVALPEAYSIYFDGTILSARSANDVSGPGYETKKKVDNPYGIHTTTIMLDDRPAFQAQLSLAPFRLLDTLTSAKIGRKFVGLKTLFTCQ
jgi:hypothetical protein